MAGRTRPSAGKVRGSLLCVASQYILHTIGWRTSQSFVEPLFQEMRQIFNLLLRERRCGSSAEPRMAVAQKSADFIAISISQHDRRTNKVWSILRPASFGSVARNALRNINDLPSVGCRSVDRDPAYPPDLLLGAPARTVTKRKKEQPDCASWRFFYRWEE